MNCIKTKENLDAFFDDELDIAHRRKIENHLVECSDCRTELENLHSIRKSVRQNPPVFAPISLDARIMSAFQNFHDQKSVEKVEKIAVERRNAWFGMPRFALAAAAILFALATITAFHIGKMSAGEISIVMPEIRENQKSPVVEPAEMKPDEAAPNVPTKIVEIPVVREKIVRVPVVQVRTVYLSKNRKESNSSGKFQTPQNQLALKSSTEDNGYMTRVDLKNFQPVTELNLQISRGEK